MPIKSCLITAAGLGTRMGKIGEVLPKPLWPIFEKRLLDIQLEYAKRFRAEKVFVNVHHQAHRIINWAKNNNVEVLIEEELLGSGGCVHNLKKHLGERGGLACVVNSDQFFFIGDKEINEGIKLIEDGNDSVLYGMHAGKEESYNETCVANNRLIQIRKNEKKHDYLTYSGVCLINLDKLSYKAGPSGFFETVCNYKDNEKIYFYGDTRAIEYWDFGEKYKYALSLMNSVTKECEMKQILKNAKALDFEKKYTHNNIIEFEKYEMKIDLGNRTIELEGLIDHF